MDRLLQRAGLLSGDKHELACGSARFEPAVGFGCHLERHGLGDLHGQGERQITVHALSVAPDARRLAELAGMLADGRVSAQVRRRSTAASPARSIT